MRPGLVVPVLDEADQLPALAAHLRSTAPGFEVVVVDGGSSDGSPDVARAAGLRVVHGPRGRARQMNTGAAALDSDALLFLHADSRLPPCAEALVRRTLEDPAVALGAFRFALDGGGLRDRALELGVAARVRLLATPYGDQALFLRRSTFAALGGYTELRLMEDLDLVRRARSRGRVVVLDRPCLTSARRWRRHGYLRTSARHLGFAVAFAAGWRPT